MERQERIIDLREYFVSLRRHLLSVLAVSVILAVLLAGYDYYKQKKDASESAVSINKIMTQNHDAYYGMGSSQYTDADVPEGTYNSAARLYIDFDYSDVEGSQDMDFNSLNNKYELDAAMLVWSSDVLDAVIRDLDLNSYEDMKDFTRDSLMWLVNKNFQGAHVMNIVVTDVDPERGYNICNEVVDKFTDVLKKYMKVNEVRILDRPSKVEADKNIEASVSVSYNKVAKYGIAGFAAGFILMCIVYLIIFIVKDTVHTRDDLEFAGFRQYGAVMDHSRADEAAGKVALSLELNDNVKNILIADADGRYDAGAFAAKVNEALEGSSGKTVAGSEERADAPQTLKMLKDVDSVLLTVSYDKTRMKDLETICGLLADMNVTKLGAVIVK